MAVAPRVSYETVPATATHTATVVFIHGLGDSPDGMRPIVDAFKVDPSLAHVKWILPNSPNRPVKANLGMHMPSWYDIYHFGLNVEEDEEGMLASAALLHELIKYEIEINETDPSRIFLAGFSQGGVMALLSGLTSTYKIAGIGVMSSWLPLRTKFKDLAAQHAASIPVFWGAGRVDHLVVEPLTKESIEILVKQLGFKLTKPGEFGGLSFNMYEGRGHPTIPQERDDLKAFIKQAIPATPK